MKHIESVKAVAKDNGLRNPSDYFAGNQKAFSISDFRRRISIGQCFKCQSDYMKFSVEGICQYCLQRIEFINREHAQRRRKIHQIGGRQK